MHIEFTINLQAFYLWGLYYVLGMVGMCFMLLAIVDGNVKNHIATVLLRPITVLVLLCLFLHDLYTGRFSRSKR